MAEEINFMVGGEAGQGVQTVGFVLAKTMSRVGLNVFADQDYESRVRGGHSFFRIRAGQDDIGALTENVDILLAIDQATVDIHRGEVKPEGIIIFDPDKIKVDVDGARSLGVPLTKLAEESASDKLMTNTVAAGAAVAMAGYDFEPLAGVLQQQFARLSKEVAENNVKAARAGYDYVRRERPQSVRRAIPPAADGKKMLLNGNDAVALGAIAAGCKFIAQYPMTPSSPILEYMATKDKDFHIIAIQPEDEIAGINMVVGATFAGVRAMTATSGGGFSLMVEALSLAGITESPVVAVLGQRPGPAVGLPTRTEQGELWFAIHAGHGEFPRAVLAPATIEDCFYATTRAFNLAESYQTPVIIMTDHHLATSYQTVPRFDLSRVTIQRGELLSAEEVDKLTDYKRHRFTESGISPRAIPLQGKALVVTDSDEHDEAGHLIEDAATRTRMVLKRFKKVEGMEREMEPPRFHERQDAEVTLVGWGSTYGAMKEAAAMLTADGTITNILHLSDVWPFPVEAVRSALTRTRLNFVVESNYTGQLAELIRMKTGIEVLNRINRFDGRPISPAYILQEMKKGVGYHGEHENS